MFKLWNIRKNILFLVLTPTVLICVVLSIYFINDRINTLESSHLAKGKIIVSSISLISQSHSPQQKTELQQQLIEFRDSDRDILAIALFNVDGETIVYAGNTSFLQALKILPAPENYQQLFLTKYLKLLKPVTLSGTSENYYLAVLLDRNTLLLESYRTTITISVIVIIILIFSLYITLHLSKIIRKPLHKISDELEAINNGVLDIQVHTPDIPELARISNTINSLALSLKQSKSEMHNNIEQATADLTQTLETIEIQNIELDMARKQAIQASRVKSEFLANISHEIRTPMNGVIGFTNLLLNSDIDKTQKDYLLTIRKSANNLLSIIEDILDFSKIEAGKMSIDEVSYSLRDCVEEVISMLSTSSSKKHLELIPLIYNDVPEILLGDPVRVKQILTNLISNSIKFTEKGSIVVRILLEEENEEYQVIRTTITDTGIGMNDDQIHSLFQPFTQVNQSIDRHHSGTGLGLVICKKLVEQMGGEITVESKSNEGSSFSYTLLNATLNNTNDKRDKIKPEFNSPDQIVFIYDPHPMALLALKHLLINWDMKVHDFQNINKLMSEVENQHKHKLMKPIILLGIAKENRSLSSVTELLNSKYRALCILGNSTDQSDIETLLDRENTCYLEKPLTRKQLTKSFEDMGVTDKKAPSKVAADETGKQFSQLRILAVDDNPANLKLISIILEEMMIDVVQAYDGLSAVTICKEDKFDLIFMDIRMPVLDGIGATKQIRVNGENKRTPIIALTAHAMAGEKELLMSNNFDDCITKPISTFQLEKIISRWTGQIAEPVVRNTVPKPAVNTATIDWETCLDISGGREKLAREMLNDLVTAIPEFKRQLEDAENDSKELLSVVHKLHGFACYTGVPTIQMQTAKLEKQLKANTPEEQTDKHIIGKQHAALIAELSKVVDESAIFLS
ncbi:MAG: response regulator [Gammaproteobacteria bacterium]|nr:response regulator [Gammaproteobacteria bacterium]